MRLVSHAWEARVMPLYDTRDYCCAAFYISAMLIRSTSRHGRPRVRQTSIELRVFRNIKPIAYIC